MNLIYAVLAWVGWFWLKVKSIVTRKPMGE